MCVIEVMDKREYRKCQREKRTMRKNSSKTINMKMTSTLLIIRLFFMLSSHFGVAVAAAAQLQVTVTFWFVMHSPLAFLWRCHCKLNRTYKTKINQRFFPFHYVETKIKTKYFKWHSLMGFGWCFPKCGIHCTVNFRLSLHRHVQISCISNLNIIDIYCQNKDETEWKITPSTIHALHSPNRHNSLILSIMNENGHVIICLPDRKISEYLRPVTYNLSKI